MGKKYEQIVDSEYSLKVSVSKWCGYNSVMTAVTNCETQFCKDMLQNVGMKDPCLE